MQTKNSATTVSEMVREDYRIADVFKKWGINYCCGGNAPLDDVCRQLSLDAAKVQDDILKEDQAKNTCIFSWFDHDVFISIS